MKVYDLSRKFISAKAYNKTDITKRINTFYMFNQLTQGEYEELMALIETTYVELGP